MHAPAQNDVLVRGAFQGLRVTADEYFQLPNDGARYELVDGVMVMSPSATPEHQNTAAEIFHQLRTYVRRQKIGTALFETDVQLGPGPEGQDEVLRPEIVFIRADRAKNIRKRIVGAPDVVVEVVSPDSRLMDTRTKFEEYERAGVLEYWLIDPERETMNFYRRDGGKFVEAAADEKFFASTAVPGFKLDLVSVRETFKGF